MKTSAWVLPLVVSVSGLASAGPSAPSLLDSTEAYGRLGFDPLESAPRLNLRPGIGACCLALGVCVVIEESECAQQGGTFQGEGTGCDPNPCPSFGACCFADGSCIVMSQHSCIKADGAIEYYPGVTCDPHPCPASGACCRIDGTCAISVAAYCSAPSLYQGDGTTCDVVVCPPTGACCFGPDVCQEWTEAGCQYLNGDYVGDGTACPVSGPCSAEGDCCFPDGLCIFYNADACKIDGGTFLGVGVPCEPNPCEPVPIDRSSWGEIKSRYR